MADTFYYSADGDRIPLRASTDALLIAYRGEVPSKDLEKLIRGDDQFAQFIKGKELQRRNLVLYKRNANAKTSLEALAIRLVQSSVVAYVSTPYYLGELLVLVADEFIAAFKPGVLQAAIETLNKLNNVEIVSAYDFAPNTFLLRVSDPTLHATLEIANRYFETGLVYYAEPNFIRFMELQAPFIPNDPLFPQQWHLPRIQAPEAWDITRGDAGIIIAVVDDGVDLNHEDFATPAKVVAGWDFVNEDNDPRPALPDNNHGTAVSGVATANGNNGIGVTGSAPNCRLMAIRLLGAPYSDDKAARAFQFAADNGVSVINNSWGPDTRKAPAPLPGIIRGAIDYATDTGRSGRGCVVLFASCNYNISISNPATLNGLAGYNRVIAVAACNDVDVRSGYSNFGTSISICAPSGGTSSNPALLVSFPPDGSTRDIFTTDRMGNVGYSPPPPTIRPDPAGAEINYTGTFSGTSSACPLTAGVAALLVSINPSLTWQQARFILEATADKINSSNTDPIGQYQVNGHSQWYGYGRVNAFEAVKGARSSVQARDFVQRTLVTLRRTVGDRFVSTKVVQTIDARRRQIDTTSNAFVRASTYGFLHSQLGPELANQFTETNMGPTTILK